MDLVVDKNVLPLAQRIPFISRLIVWENRKHKLGEILKLSQELKGGRYDLSVAFNPSQEFNIITFFSGIPLRSGYDRKWGFLLNRKTKDTKEQGLKHEAEYNLELLRTIDIEADTTDVRFPLDIKNEDFPDNRLAESGISDNNFIAIHPWSSNPEKELARDKFRQLCASGSSPRAWGTSGRGGFEPAPTCKIVLIGGQGEAKRSGEFCRGLPVIDLTGKTSLLELAGLLKRSRLLVTVDSGPMHLSAALGRPVVAIFRKNPPGVSARRWGPVGDKHIIIENDRIENIKVDEVLNGVRKAFSG